MNTDWLIVGAGLTGVTLAERIASQRGERVVIVDQRDHIAGNAYDEYDERGILTHVYGPHIFHTNSRDVFDYLSAFTAWTPYTHKVLAVVEGHLVPVPFNLTSLQTLYPPQVAAKLTDTLIATYGAEARVPILKMRESANADIKHLADYVYRNIFENYTKKQWDLTPEELSPSVTSRVPILVSHDDRYFQDEFQAMPRDGFTAMVRRMLAHPAIHILLKTRWQDITDDIHSKRIVFTGPIDEFFAFCHGALPYRSLRFESATYEVERKQAAAVINYPNDYAYTRTSEQKWFTGQLHAITKVVTEYPQAHRHGETIPYYPIPTDANRAQFKLYEEEAMRLGGAVIFAGRLGDYQYYNMDQAVARALTIFKKLM